MAGRPSDVEAELLARRVVTYDTDGDDEASAWSPAIVEYGARRRVLRYPVSATAADNPLPSKGQESFPSWTSPVRPRSPALDEFKWLAAAALQATARPRVDIPEGTIASLQRRDCRSVPNNRSARSFASRRSAFSAPAQSREMPLFRPFAAAAIEFLSALTPRLRRFTDCLRSVAPAASSKRLHARAIDPGSR